MFVLPLGDDYIMGDQEESWEVEEHKTISLGRWLLGGIQALWKSDALLDYTIIVEDKSFRVHRVVMAAVSDFFKVMLQGNMQESQLSSVELRGVTVVGLEPLLQYIYTDGPLNLTRENVLDVLAAASHLQVRMVMEPCIEFLSNFVDMENCVDILNLIFLYHLPFKQIKLDEQAVECLIDNLDDIVKEGHFLRLSVDAFQYILSHEAIHRSELYLLDLVRQWVAEDPPSRVPQTKLVLRSVRFEIMTTSELDKLSKDGKFCLEDPACREFIQEAQKYRQKTMSEQVIQQNEKTKVRGKQVIVSFSGLQESAYPNCSPMKSRSMFMYDNNGWQPIIHGPTRTKCLVPPECNFHQAAVTVVNNFMVVCGGLKMSAVRLATSACHIFDPRCYRWGRLASMIFPRADFALIAHDNHLFAFGGEVRNSEFTNTVERYSFATDQWQVVTKMERKFTSLSAVLTDNIILVSGGKYLDGRGKLKVSRDMNSFDPVKITWQPRIPMRLALSGHTMVEMFGNRNDKWQPEKVVYVIPRSGQSIEAFDPINLRWEKHKVWEKVPGAATVVSIDDKLYFINGRAADKFERCVQMGVCVCCDPLIALNHWHYPQSSSQTEMACYPEPVIKPLSCVLMFPMFDVH